jgi:hypothetical protein
MDSLYYAYGTTVTAAMAIQAQNPRINLEYFEKRLKYSIPAHIEQRTDAGRTSLARRLKAAEQSKNHVFTLRSYRLKRSGCVVLSDTWRLNIF